ncbi:MAG TPA: hypothetical protein VHR66_20350 [Gemmataceae bacterium]|jgi:hypothetical protein|nr:hypothetical protein [Gemmataceae bacterium]
MAHVDITEYEVMHDLLPRVCAQCGEPALKRVKVAVRIIDGWRGALQLLGLFVGLFFFPPLIVPILSRYSRTIWVRVPMCDIHRAEHKRRVRLFFHKVMPWWTAAVIALDVFAIVELIAGGPGFWCVGVFLVLFVVVAADVGFVSRGTVTVGKPPKVGARLSRVHPAFVEALIAERSRDRISNPERRGGHGDVRDDFDDEVI